MSREINDILKQIREGKSTLSTDEAAKLEPELSVVDEFLTSGTIQDTVLLPLIDALGKLSRDLAARAIAQNEDSDISTRMSNIAGWEVASLVGLVCTHHIFVTARAKGSPSSACVAVYISAVDFLLGHEETRSRACAATLVRAIAKSLAARPSASSQLSADVDGAAGAVHVYELLYAVILRHVQQHVESREADTRPIRLMGAGGGAQQELNLDDLSGWRNLETSYAAYRALIEGFGGRYMHLVRASPQACHIFISTAGMHLNRYVRQAACELIGVMCQCALSVPPHADESLAGASSLSRLGEQGNTGEGELEGCLLDLFSQVLGAGMEDSWCQVRLASTQAAGVLLRWVKHLCPPGSSHSVLACTPLWELLVPRLCLNRHYSTDSVRIAAHHAWRHITLHCPPAELGGSEGGAGVLALPAVTRAVVDFYTAMTRHKNHMVCEAACAAIAELGSRVDAAAVAPYLPTLCLSLRSSLADTSWPIRDTAATAVGRFLRYNGPKLAPSYFSRPALLASQGASGSASQGGVMSAECLGGGGDEGEARPSMKEVVGDLLGLLFTCLCEDPFRPVRESAAVGLVDICLHQDVELDCDVWWNIEKYLRDHVLALCSRSPNDLSASASSAFTSSSQTAGKKTVQFIPAKMLAALLMKSGGIDEKKTAPHSQSAAVADGDDVRGRWLYSDWEEVPGEPRSSSNSNRRKKRKEALAQRVSAGWGCCLDCGAGDGGQVSPSEESWASLLLLRELRETVLLPGVGSADLAFDFIELQGDCNGVRSRSKSAAVHCLLWTHLRDLWTLLTPTHYKDCAKFHTFLYEQVTAALEMWFPADRSSCLPAEPPLAPPMSSPFSLPSLVPPEPLTSPEGPDALLAAMRVCLLNARPQWKRDCSSVGRGGAPQWLHPLLPGNEQGDQLSASSAMLVGDISAQANNADLHSPQKVIALDACLSKIRDVFGTDFIRELLQ